jgi:hypothetical protein
VKLTTTEQGFCLNFIPNLSESTRFEIGDPDAIPARAGNYSLFFPAHRFPGCMLGTIYSSNYFIKIQKFLITTCFLL